MKIAILAAGGSDFFPLFIDKPKCLYHLNGKIQLQRVIEDAQKFVEDKDIIVVGGYKHKFISEFLRKYPNIDFRINERYAGPAIYSFRKAIENINDDVVFMFADERISLYNVEKIVMSDKKIAILCHDEYYYYSLGILKLRKDVLDYINDDRYLSMNVMKEIYCFANKKSVYDGIFNINSGICIGYIIIDFIRRIGGIKKIENPINTYKGNDIEFIHYDMKCEYVRDLDHFSDTDEYKNSVFLRAYSDYISDNLHLLIRAVRKMKRVFYRWKS